jgi:hypothetical protein
MSPIVDAGGFAPSARSKRGRCATGLLVVSPDRAGVTRALRRARPRLWCVLSDGRELDSAEEVESTYEQGGRNVSWVSEPRQHIRGVGIDVDFKGAKLQPEMGATYRRVVREELERGGVREARLEVPTPGDAEYEEEGMFASVGARSVVFDRIHDLQGLLRALQDGMPDRSMLIAGSGYAPESIKAFLATHDRRAESPLSFLSEWPAFWLDPATSRAFWEAAAVSEGPFELIGTPWWIVEDERVLAYVPAAREPAMVRVRADLDSGVLYALEALQERPAAGDPPRLARPNWFGDREARERLVRTKPDLQPGERDWWAPAWRTWEPIPEPPGAPSPFDIIETAARVRESVEVWWTSGKRYWHWRRAPFGPAPNPDEVIAMATAWHELTRTTRQAVTELMRYVPGTVSTPRVSHYLPRPAGLAGLVAIAGAAYTTEMLLGLDTSNRNYADAFPGYRAAVLPHLSEPERSALRDQVSDQCKSLPWTKGRNAPHAAHLLAGQLGLHDICAETLATNPDVRFADGVHLLVHGLGSVEEVVAAHRSLGGHRFLRDWHAYAWLTVTGIDGVPELFEAVSMRPGYTPWPEQLLAPLLRLSSPTLEPYMQALVGTHLDKWARAWLGQHAR